MISKKQDITVEIAVKVLASASIIFLIIGFFSFQGAAVNSNVSTHKIKNYQDSFAK